MFGVSEEAVRWMRERGYPVGDEYVLPGESSDNGTEYTGQWPPFAEDVDRTAEGLVAVVEELGEKANGVYADLLIVEIPDSVDWYISEYDGYETVREEHRTWP